eukprot:1440744-Amphidinium_carterae.1
MGRKEVALTIVAKYVLGACSGSARNSTLVKHLCFLQGQKGRKKDVKYSGFFFTATDYVHFLIFFLFSWDFEHFVDI